MRLSPSYFNYGPKFWTNFLQINSLQFIHPRGLKAQRMAWSPSLFLKLSKKYYQNLIQFSPFGSTGSFPGFNQRPAIMEISGDQSNLVVGTFPVNSNGL